MLGEEGGELSRKRLVGEAPRREVDGDGDVEALVLPRAPVVERALDHPARERPDQPCLLGQRQELGRREQSAGGVDPAHERLHALERAGRGLELRLVVQRELALGDPAPQLAEQAEPRLRVRVDLG